MTNGDEPVSSSPYAGRWIARIGQVILCQGGSAEQVFKTAKAIRSKENAIISYIPLERIMTFHPVFRIIQQTLAGVSGVYLVGGAVRDGLLGREAGDLDFVIQAGTEKIARQIAGAIKSDFFPLDREREVFRLIVHEDEGKSLYLDFTRMRGSGIDSDLAARDFTINAMAVDIHDPQKLIDPLGGAQDLRDGILRACSPTSFQDDPVRLLRAARLASEMGLKVDGATLAMLKSHRLLLANSTPERRRDEFFKGLQTRPAKFLNLIHNLKMGGLISPRLEIPADHQEVWQRRVQMLDRLLALLRPGRVEREENLWSGLLLNEMRDFRMHIIDLSEQRPQQDRQRSALWYLACLLWNGMPLQELEQVCRDLVLSNDELEVVRSIARGKLWLEANPGGSGVMSDREMHRYFYSAGQSGLDAVILHLANSFIGRSGQVVADPPVNDIHAAVSLMRSWWYQYDQIVAPPLLLDGHAIQQLIGVQPGPVVGELITDLREEQAAGAVQDRGQAEEFVKMKFNQTGN